MKSISLAAWVLLSSVPVPTAWDSTCADSPHAEHVEATSVLQTRQKRVGATTDKEMERSSAENAGISAPEDVTGEGSCFQRDVQYIPDMLGQERSVENSALSCQQRCASVSGCAHFTFWYDGGCHLQDRAAFRTPRNHLTGGPAACGQIDTPVVENVEKMVTPEVENADKTAVPVSVVANVAPVVPDMAPVAPVAPLAPVAPVAPLAPILENVIAVVAATVAPDWQEKIDLGLPGNCGFAKECPRDYNLPSSVDTPEIAKASYTNALAALHVTARASCVKSATSHDDAILEHGGWCYDTYGSSIVKKAIGAQGQIKVTNTIHTNGESDIDYILPMHHVPADQVIVATLAQHVVLKQDGTCCNSITDLGAGVGQYGHALRARYPSLEYYGYDGAGNVEEFTENYVRFTDLTQPLFLKRTDWVMSVEVGEHIPHKHEAQVIANLHAHNCKGIILSWAVPGQTGNGHINCHSNQYLITVFEELGYKLNANITAALRATSDDDWWFHESAMAFDRISKPSTCG